MVQVTVKARKVGDSIVMTLPKQVLESTGFSEGVTLMLESNSEGFLSVRKENDKVSNLKEAELELAVLNRKLEVVIAESDLAVSEYNHSMPTVHQGITDQYIMESFMKEMNFKGSEIRLEIAEKELEIYRMSGAEPQPNPEDDNG